MTGHSVSFVGAGPGDPRLITVLGRDLLEKADLVLYAGSLVSPAVLDWCSKDCRLVDSASIDLETQINIMVAAVEAGQKVVRLHTGDPSLYGAIAEQIALLDRQGIAVSIVPGVSSFQAAAARLAIEYTIPGGTQTVICSRRKGRTPVPDEESLDRLAAHGSTLVLFLSSGQAQAVVDDLIAAGRSKTTPAACVYRATWPDERIIRTSLADLPQAMEEASIENHALLIVGDCLLPSGGRSCLYDRSFSHGFRLGGTGDE
jgi:precorrin-4/cobalt-precorrin-4 C11-methyltransferase